MSERKKVFCIHFAGRDTKYVPLPSDSGARTHYTIHPDPTTARDGDVVQSRRVAKGGGHGGHGSALEVTVFFFFFRTFFLLNRTPLKIVFFFSGAAPAPSPLEIRRFFKGSYLGTSEYFGPMEVRFSSFRNYFIFC